MTKTEFLSALEAKNPGMPRVTLSRVLDSIGQVVAEGLKTSGEAIVPGVAKFKAVHKPATEARPGVNPFTKQPVMIPAKPASMKVKASPAKSIKDACA
jgi:DNA-binding protein HU-beta